MIRLLARLHGVDRSSRVRDQHGLEPGVAITRSSAVLGLITSGIVIAHMVALGASGFVLFLRFGTGYTTRETTMLGGMAVIAVLSFGFAARRAHRQPNPTAETERGHS